MTHSTAPQFAQPGRPTNPGPLNPGRPDPTPVEVPNDLPSENVPQPPEEVPHDLPGDTPPKPPREVPEKDSSETGAGKSI